MNRIFLSFALISLGFTSVSAMKKSELTNQFYVAIRKADFSKVKTLVQRDSGLVNAIENNNPKNTPLLGTITSIFDHVISLLCPPDPKIIESIAKIFDPNSIEYKALMESKNLSSDERMKKIIAHCEIGTYLIENGAKVKNEYFKNISEQIKMLKQDSCFLQTNPSLKSAMNKFLLIGQRKESSK